MIWLWCCYWCLAHDGRITIIIQHYHILQLLVIIDLSSVGICYWGFVIYLVCTILTWLCVCDVTATEYGVCIIWAGCWFVESFFGLGFFGFLAGFFDDDDVSSVDSSVVECLNWMDGFFSIKIKTFSKIQLRLNIYWFNFSKNFWIFQVGFYISSDSICEITCENIWFFGESGTTTALVGRMGVGLRIGSGVGIVVGIIWVCWGDTAIICDEGNGWETDTFRVKHYHWMFNFVCKHILYGSIDKIHKIIASIQYNL